MRRSLRVRTPAARALALSLVVPGLGHLVYQRRITEGVLLVTFTFLWGLLGIVQISTLWAHVFHVSHEAYPGILAQILLYGALLPVIGAVAGVGLTREMRRQQA